MRGFDGDGRPRLVYVLHSRKAGAGVNFSRIVLYKHGVAFFQRNCTVDGDQLVTLRFKYDEMDDIMKSLTVIDLDGGKAGHLRYPSSRPSAFEANPVRLEDGAAITSLLGSIRGREVEVSAGDEATAGRVLGTERIDLDNGSGRTIKAGFLSILAPDGAVRSFEITKLTRILLKGEDTPREVREHLDNLISSTRQQTRSVSVACVGKGRRRVLIQYVTAAPVWKVSYRVVLRSDGPPWLQGWAMVDNVTEEDWSDVAIAFVSGVPISFEYDLYPPRFIQRPKLRPTGEFVAPPPVNEEADVQGPGIPAEMTQSAARGLAAKSHLRPLAEPAEAPRSRPASPTADVATTPENLGELFEYAVDTPVTIGRGESAMIPILETEIQCRNVVWFNEDNHRLRPMSAVYLTNDTALTLDQGPVTVIREGRYVGEALLPFSRPREKKLLAYAVEIGIEIESKVRTKHEAVHLVSAHAGRLNLYQYEVCRRTYTVKNQTGEEKVLLLDHRALPQRGRKDYSLVDTPEPIESTPTMLRFEIVCPPGETELCVSERSSTCRTYALSDLDTEKVEVFVSGRLLSNKERHVIEEILAAKQRHRQVEAAIAERESRLEKIEGEQERLRKNIKALGNTADETTLRNRYVAKLTQQEDEVERIRDELTALRQDEKQQKETLAHLVDKVVFEHEVEQPMT